ncbi:MAG: transposase [Nitrososphaera sp.]
MQQAPTQVPTQAQTKVTAAINRRAVTRRATVARHRQMSCRVYKLKLDSSHIGRELACRISRMFLEAKWLYNHVLSQPDPYNYDYKQASVSVQVKVRDHFEQRTITQLSAQMRQDIVKRVKNNIVSLARLKEKGYRVGRLKFKSRMDSIPLRSHGQTYTIFRESNRIKIQGIKKRLVVRGLKQIPPVTSGVEFANAALVRKPSGYYLYVTVYVPKDMQASSSSPSSSSQSTSTIGIDFGLHNQLTLSNGITIRYSVPVATRKVRLLHRELTRRGVHHGKNWWKTRIKLRRAYEHTNNVKADVRNKIVSCLVNNFDTICIQRDDIRSWQQLKLPARKRRVRVRGRKSRHWSGGMKVLETAIGGITGALLKKARTPVVIPSDFKSTETCSGCGRLNEIAIGERTYRCSHCQLVIDRDYNAAINIEREGMAMAAERQRQKHHYHLPVERRKVTPVDTGTSTSIVECLSGIPYVEASTGGRNRKPPCFSRR